MKKFLLGLVALMFVGVAGAATPLSSASEKPRAIWTCAPSFDIVDHLDLRDPIHRAAFGQIFDLSVWLAGKEAADGYHNPIPSAQRIRDAIESDIKQVEITGRSPQMMAIYREVRGSRMYCK